MEFLSTNIFCSQKNFHFLKRAKEIRTLQEAGTDIRISVQSSAVSDGRHYPSYFPSTSETITSLAL